MAWPLPHHERMGEESLKMSCPSCQRPRDPLSSSTHAIAWFCCLACDVEWSARLRDGRPFERDIGDLDAPDQQRKKPQPRGEFFGGQGRPFGIVSWEESNFFPSVVQPV